LPDVTTMTRHRRRTQALREAAVMALAIVAGVVVIVAARQRPAGAERLKIPIGTLRSTVAELALVDQHAGGALPPRFVRAHTGQLAQRIDEARDALSRMEPRPELRAQREAVLDEARQLRDETESMQRSGNPLPDAARDALLAQAQRLKGREDGLRR
jgi:hypothetical protein